ncbi:MAG: hypothetical protein H6Q99_3097 [Proteobacteria bacterium]|nr:hypothetical protein [Pseudomonadota bacterium]
MQSINGRTGRTSYKSVYRSVGELEARLTGIYGPSLKLGGTGSSSFSFRTSTFRDSDLALCDCYTGDTLNSSFNSDSDDIIITTRSRGEFAIHTWCGDHRLAQDVGFVFTMNHALGYSSTRSTATTTLQIGRSGFETALRRYAEDLPAKWSGIQGFSLGSGFGHLIQALSGRYRENFDSRAECTYSEASLKLIRDATMVAIADLTSRGPESGRGEKFAASRRNVLRAVDLINNQTSPLTIHDLATSLGISVRALQDGFRKHLNTSPHSLLKTGRLEGARRDLISGKANSIREAAARWGFSNIARFSQEYHAVVGKYPKDTVRIWRGGAD